MRFNAYNYLQRINLSQSYVRYTKLDIFRTVKLKIKLEIMQKYAIHKANYITLIITSINFRKKEFVAVRTFIAERTVF